MRVGQHSLDLGSRAFRPLEFICFCLILIACLAYI